MQFRREWEGACLLIFRGAGIERHSPGLEIHLPPLQWEDFATNSPTGDVCKTNDRLQGLRKIPADALKLLTLEKAGSCNMPDLLGQIVSLS